MPRVEPIVHLDFNNSGLFGSTEDVSSYVKQMSWNRGGDPEMDTTPAGTMSIMIDDPNGDFIPGSTASAFGSTSINVGLTVRARCVIQPSGSTYGVFRGKVERISNFIDAEAGLSAILFCVDEMDRLKNTFVTWPVSVASTGDVSHSTGRPLTSYTAGSSTGLIAKILDDASFASTRRALTEVGQTTFDYWWVYNTSAKTALEDIEKHELGRIFISSSGDVTFHDSAHNNGSTAAYTFSANFDQFRFTLSSRQVKNQAVVTTHSREAQSADKGVMGGSNSTSIPNISSGSVYTTVIDFVTQNVPAWTAIVPLAEADSTKGISMVGVGSGSTYTGANATISGTLLGASGMRLAITNNTGETVFIRHPQNATDTQTVAPIEGTRLYDLPNTSTAQNTASMTAHGIRGVSADYPFFSLLGKASQRATDLANNNSTARATGVTLSVTANSSDLVTQLLTREIGDRIAVTSTALKMTAKNFYIAGADWSLNAGGLLEADYTLDEAT